MAPLLIQLVRYAEEHFQREKRIMAQPAFPVRDQQHEIHGWLCKTIFELNRRLESDSLSLDQDAVAIPKHCPVDHILREDKKLGVFIVQQSGA